MSPSLWVGISPTELFSPWLGNQEVDVQGCDQTVQAGGYGGGILPISIQQDHHLSLPGGRGGEWRRVMGD